MPFVSFQLMQGLYEFLQEQPFAYLDEMQAFIYDEYDMVVSVSTISRALKRAKISRKKVHVSEFVMLNM